MIKDRPIGILAHINNGFFQIWENCGNNSL
jgi:hypothetical protein